MRLIFLMFVTTLLLPCVYAVEINSLPPVVVETYPKAGKTNVDPSITKISVTFSKQMKTKQMWSWVYHSKDSFPTLVDGGKIHYLKDGKTCVASVKLQSNKTYAIWFNSQKFSGFRDENGNAAVPYLLVFKTRK